MSVASPSASPLRVLRERVSLLHLLEDAGLLCRLHRVGSRYVGPCPVHGGDHPRAFSVDPDRGLWFCFTRCGGGDVVALAHRLCGGSWRRTFASLERLAATLPAGHAAPRPRHGCPLPRARPFRPFTRALPLDPLHPFFHRIGLRPRTLRRFEAGAWHGPGYLEGTVAVRLHDPDGRPLGYAGRRLDPEAANHQGKWKWPPGFPKARLLYGWHRARPHIERGLVVVESPWSVMKLSQAGIPNAVALGGLSVSAPQQQLLAAAPRLLLFLDADTAGRHATRSLTARPIHPKLLIATPGPEGTDPADLDETSLRRTVQDAWPDLQLGPVPVSPH